MSRREGISHDVGTLSSKIQTYLDQLSPKAFVVFSASVSLLIVLLFFSPRYRLWHLPASDQFAETARASTFLAQCEVPLRGDVEPTMRWRFLPPLVCHALGLRNWSAFAIPWIGVSLLLLACASIASRMGRAKALIATIIIGTTSAILVPVGWLGMNDAWVWFALLGTAFGRPTWIPAMAGLLGPWVDERYIIGLSLALWVRTLNFGKGSWKQGLWALPYLGIRGVLTLMEHETVSSHFLHRTLTECPKWLPYAPLGWWMAFRLGWGVIGSAGLTQWKEDRRRTMISAGLIFATLLVSAVLAGDLSRSAAIVLPILVWAFIEIASRWSFRDFGLLLGAQLVVPVVHILETKMVLISSLPVELFRFARQPWLP